MKNILVLTIIFLSGCSLYMLQNSKRQVGYGLKPRITASSIIKAGGQCRDEGVCVDAKGVSFFCYMGKPGAGYSATESQALWPCVPATGYKVDPNSRPAGLTHRVAAYTILKFGGSCSKERIGECTDGRTGITYICYVGPYQELMDYACLPKTWVNNNLKSGSVLSITKSHVNQ